MKLEVSIIDSIGERIERDGINSLTEPERHYHAIYALEAEASNGAFQQFFSNEPGSIAFFALAGLRAVGAHRMAESLDSAIDLFPERQIPEDWTDRNARLDALSEQAVKLMDGLSANFTDYPDDLSRLLEEYVKKHDSEFCGPKTLMDMWRSKRARGADTASRYIARKIDFAVEAEKDRPYSSRVCPECGYPSPDYRPTCKRCGFPHGKSEDRTKRSTQRLPAVTPPANQPEDPPAGGAPSGSRESP